jgi:hypothetical protein
MYLGIDNNTMLVYEGGGGPDTPSIPTPALTLASIVERIGDKTGLPGSLYSAPFGWLFREDSFDPVSRTRRGRLYQSDGGGQPRSVRVSPHPYDLPGRWPTDNPQRHFDKSLFVYSQCSQLLNRPKKGLGEILALGSPEAVSYWRIVQTEMLVTRAVMVTLKALSSYDILPELDEAQVSEEFRPEVKRALEKVLDSAFRETPDSVVNYCRNALTVIISRWLVQRGHDRKVLDLDIAKVAVAAVEKERFCAANMAQTVGLLHNRTKENVVQKKELRYLTEEDAELAIQAVGLTLRDLGWAKQP